MNKLQFRLVTLLPVVFCVGLLGYANYLEHVEFINPCPLCLLQRGVFYLIGVLFALAAIKPVLYWGRKLFGGFLLLASAAGAAVAGRHVWLQSLPADQVPDCGQSLEVMLEMNPLFEVLKTVLNGDGSCAEVSWSMFGLSMPYWTLFAYIGMFFYSLIWAFLRVKDE